MILNESTGLAQCDAQPLLHLLVEGSESGHRAHEDGELGDAAVLIELEEVDALELAVADVGLEAQGDRAAFVQLVYVGEAFERGGDVGEDGADHLAALEAAEEDRAVQDDVLAQRLGQQVEVLGFGGAAKRMRVGHGFHSTLSLSFGGLFAYKTQTQSLGYSPGAKRPHAREDLELPRSHRAALGGQDERAALPALWRSDRGEGRPRARPAPHHDGTQVGPAADRAGRLPRRR